MILVILAAVFTYLKPVFMNGTNLLNMIKRMSYVAVSAFGMTFLLTLGVFDMSAGSTAALVGVLLAYRDLVVPDSTAYHDGLRRQPESG